MVADGADRVTRASGQRCEAPRDRADSDRSTARVTALRGHNYHRRMTQAVGGDPEIATSGEGARERANVLTVRGLSVALFRLSHRLGSVSPVLGHLVKQVNHVVTGADVAWQARIGPDLDLLHPTGVVIGHLVRIGSGCRIQSGVTLGGRGGPDDGQPVIGDGVIIGAGARVLGPIRLGDGCVVGANAVVLADVPTGQVAVGIPAKVRPPRS